MPIKWGSKYERYYQFVRRYLQEQGLWGKTISRFPPAALKSLVKKIVDRYTELGMDPDSFNWQSLTMVRDFRTVDDVIDELESRGLLPTEPVEARAENLDMLMQYIEYLVNEYASTDPSLLKDARDMIEHALGEKEEESLNELEKLKREAESKENQIRSLSREISRLKEQLEQAKGEKARYEELRKALDAKLAEYREANRELRDKVKEYEARIQELENMLDELRSKVVPVPPTPPTPETAPSGVIADLSTFLSKISDTLDEIENGLSRILTIYLSGDIEGAEKEVGNLTDTIRKAREEISSYYDILLSPLSSEERELVETNISGQVEDILGFLQEAEYELSNALSPIPQKYTQGVTHYLSLAHQYLTEARSRVSNLRGTLIISLTPEFMGKKPAAPPPEEKPEVQPPAPAPAPLPTGPFKPHELVNKLYDPLFNIDMALVNIGDDSHVVLKKYLSPQDKETARKYLEDAISKANEYLMQARAQIYLLYESVPEETKDFIEQQYGRRLKELLEDAQHLLYETRQAYDAIRIDNYDKARELLEKVYNRYRELDEEKDELNDILYGVVLRTLEGRAPRLKPAPPSKPAPAPLSPGPFKPHELVNKLEDIIYKQAQAISALKNIIDTVRKGYIQPGYEEETRKELIYAINKIENWMRTAETQYRHILDQLPYEAKHTIDNFFGRPSSELTMQILDLCKQIRDAITLEGIKKFSKDESKLGEINRKIWGLHKERERLEQVLYNVILPRLEGRAPPAKPPEKPAPTPLPLGLYNPFEIVNQIFDPLFNIDIAIDYIKQVSELLRRKRFGPQNRDQSLKELSEKGYKAYQYLLKARPQVDQLIKYEPWSPESYEIPAATRDFIKQHYGVRLKELLSKAQELIDEIREVYNLIDMGRYDEAQAKIEEIYNKSLEAKEEKEELVGIIYNVILPRLEGRAPPSKPAPEVPPAKKPPEKPTPPTPPAPTSDVDVIIQAIKEIAPLGGLVAMNILRNMVKLPKEKFDAAVVQAAQRLNAKLVEWTPYDPVPVSDLLEYQGEKYSFIDVPSP